MPIAQFYTDLLPNKPESLISLMVSVDVTNKLHRLLTYLLGRRLARTETTEKLGILTETRREVSTYLI